jgi:DNA-binding CsgD family transcriptional regulator/PAS domain-containing protein
VVAEGLEELIVSLKELPVPAVLTDLETNEVIAENDAVVALFGPLDTALVGVPFVASRIPKNEQAAATAAITALARRIVDGFVVRRPFITKSGDEVTLEVWGRRVEYDQRPYGVWIFLPETYSSGLDPSSMVLAMTDHDWVIEYMSSDADLLGSNGSDLRGFPLLGLIHPSGAAEFLEATRRVSQDHLTVTFHTRLRVQGAAWTDRQCLLARMCEHQPPRLGVVIRSRAEEGTALRGQLTGELLHCAMESRAAHTLRALPALSLLPRGSELSARQTEIVIHLIEGKSASDIARLMYLGPSTVRNHLTAIYRKFGVHSQAELLAKLLRDTSHT